MIPVIAFALWVLGVFFYLPGLRMDLRISDALIGSQLLLSYPMLVLGWVLSGPVTACVLFFLSCLLILYVGLGAKEPEFIFQILGYFFFYGFLASYFQKMGKEMQAREIQKEKSSEDINLSQKDLLESYARKKALEEKIERLLELGTFSERLKDLAGLEEVSKDVVFRLQTVLPGAEECVLYLVDPARQELALAFGRRRDAEPVREKEGTVYDRWVMKKSQAVMVDDTENDFRFSLERQPAHAEIRSLCASALVTENRVLGVLRVSSRSPAAFTPDDLRILDIHSNLAAVTLRNILLYQKMEELAVKDGLTGLYLNRYFQERLSEEIRRSSLDQRPFSVILLDIDFFKRYNDEYGHAAGDLVLKNTASIVSASIENTDLAARYGGEEFVVLLPGRVKKDAFEVAERMRANVAANKLSLRRLEGNATVSLGVAAFPEDGRSKEELVWAADRYLYEAKRQGRNRVCQGFE